MRLRRAILPDVDVAWAAGIIDGEGSIGIYDTVTLRVSMGHAGAVAKLCEIFATGTLAVRTPRPPRKPYHCWTVRAHREVRRTLRLVLPFLVVKREEAELALAFIRSGSPELRDDLRSLCSALKCKPGHRRAA